MIEEQEIFLDEKICVGISIKTENTKALMIKADKGFLACAYFDVNIANKAGDAMAVVTGVKTFDDMLNANVIKASEKAKSFGITNGMFGKEAFKKLF